MPGAGGEGGMNSFSRTDRSVLGLWWWTVDRWTLAALAALIFIGALLVLAASPAVAVRLKLDSFYLVRHHFALLGPAIVIMLGVSLFGPVGIRRIAMVGLVIALALTAVTLFAGQEIKGARRWVDLAGLSLQPSEFLKPCFAVTAAWLFAEQHGQRRLPGNIISILLYLAIVGLLMSQPDFGMTLSSRSPGSRSSCWRACRCSGSAPSFWSAPAAWSAPITSSRMSRPASTASSIRPRATATRSTARWRPSSMAGSGAAVPARAQ